MLAECYDVFFKMGYELFNFTIFFLSTHYSKNFLYYVISVEVKRTLFNLVLVHELLKHGLSFFRAEALEANLDDSAALLMQGELDYFSLELLENQIMVRLLRSSVL